MSGRSAPSAAWTLTCSSKSQRALIPASSTTRRSCISPHRPRASGRRSAVTSAWVCTRSCSELCRAIVTCSASAACEQLPGSSSVSAAAPPPWPGSRAAAGPGARPPPAAAPARPRPWRWPRPAGPRRSPGTSGRCGPAPGPTSPGTARPAGRPPARPAPGRPAPDGRPVPPRARAPARAGLPGQVGRQPGQPGAGVQVPERGTESQGGQQPGKQRDRVHIGHAGSPGGQFPARHARRDVPLARE